MRTGAMQIRGTRIESVAKGMHIHGRKRSVGKSVFRANPEIYRR